METMHAAGRRNLPPVPRPPAEAVAPVRPTEPVEDTAVVDTPAVDTPAEDTPAEDTPVEDTTVEDTPAEDAPAEDTTAEDTTDLPAELGLDPQLLAVADDPELALEEDDPAQDFVSRLRAAAAEFAAAAGAETAVVREAVPPARHRRSRCRVVLRYADGEEVDLTFLGAVGRPGTPAWQGFDEQIQHWLGTGQQRQSAWLVEDAESPDGIAVDVPAWLAAA